MTHAAGRELLAIDLDVSPPECPSLNGKPRRSSTLELNDDERPVRSRTGTGVALLALDSKLRFVPGVACRIDGRRMHLLLAIDALDHVRRVRLAKRLPALAARAAGDPALLARDLSEQADARPPAPAEPSPAARRLLEQLELVPPAACAPAAEPPPLAHRVALAKAGLERVVAELMARDDLIELERGHLVTSSNYRRLVGELPSAPLPASVEDVAAGWGCSHGRARAILDRMIRDGLLRRDRGRYARVLDGGDDPDGGDE